MLVFEAHILRRWTQTWFLLNKAFKTTFKSLPVFLISKSLHWVLIADQQSSLYWLNLQKIYIVEKQRASLNTVHVPQGMLRSPSIVSLKTASLCVSVFGPVKPYVMPVLCPYNAIYGLRRAFTCIAFISY